MSRKKKVAAKRAGPREAPPPKLAGRPKFAERYPRHPELDRLLEAFDQGNYALVRSGTEALVRSADDEDVRVAAQDLRRRLDPEPAAVYLWALGVVLAIFIYGYYALAH